MFALDLRFILFRVVRRCGTDVMAVSAVVKRAREVKSISTGKWDAPVTADRTWSVIEVSGEQAARAKPLTRRALSDTPSPNPFVSRSCAPS